MRRAALFVCLGTLFLGGSTASALKLPSAPRCPVFPKSSPWNQRVARLPINQLVMMKLHLNQTVTAQGLHTSQILGTFFDGIARHTPEGLAFQRRAAEAGFKEAVRERDEPFGDFGR